MATPRQIAANRLNSQKSTGPRSEAGKLVSAMNALKSGLHSQRLVVPGEDQAALQTLTAEYHDEFQPVSPQERDLVDTLVHDHRIGGYRDELMGQIYRTLSEHLARVQSRLNSLERSYHRTLKELRTLMADGRERPDSPSPDPASEPVDATAPSPQIGFVPQQSSAPPAPAPVPAAVRPINGHLQTRAILVSDCTASEYAVAAQVPLQPDR